MGRNVAAKVTRVDPGAAIPANVFGGWVTKTVGISGLLVEVHMDEDLTIFVPDFMIEEADAEYKRTHGTEHLPGTDGGESEPRQADGLESKEGSQERDQSASV